MASSLTQETIRRLRSFDSPTISNAIELLNIRDRTEGYASMELRCMIPDLEPMVGYAVTCTADSSSPGGEPKPNKLSDLLDGIQSAPKPVVVVVRKCGPDGLRDCFTGDMISVVYRNLGAVGVVTDGGIRDLTGIRRHAPGFQVFAFGTVVSHGTSTIIEVGMPVSIAGLPIAPGDLLHGDESGLVKVPLASAEAVLEKARLVRETEQEWFDFANSSDFTLEGVKQRIPH